MRQNMLVDNRQLGWQWRYAGRNCCSEIVKWCILTTEFLISSAIISMPQNNQSGDLILSRCPCYGVERYRSSFRYKKIRDTFM
jgi:hypothetical protein